MVEVLKHDLHTGWAFGVKVGRPLHINSTRWIDPSWRFVVVFPLQKGWAWPGFPEKVLCCVWKKTGNSIEFPHFFWGGESISYLCHVFSFAGVATEFFSHLWQDHRIFQIGLPSKFVFNRFLRKHLSVTISSGDLLDDFQWSFEHGDQKLMYFEAEEEDDLLMVLGAYLGSFGVHVR